MQHRKTEHIYEVDMGTLQEIEKAVSSLASKELAQFRQWFEEFDAAIWDKQFEEDVQAGKLDALAERAIADFCRVKP